MPPRSTNSAAKVQLICVDMATTILHGRAGAKIKVCRKAELTWLRIPKKETRGATW